MKFLPLLAVLSVTPAFAVSYECSNPDGQKLKIFQEQPDFAVAVVQGADDSNQILKGHYVYEDEPLYDVTKYDLTSSNGEKVALTLTKKVIIGRGGCGRGGCNDLPGLSSKKAVLTINNQSKYFNCL